jgi:hypothetical protein
MFTPFRQKYQHNSKTLDGRTLCDESLFDIMDYL